MTVSLRCRCGNVGVCLREPPTHVDTSNSTQPQWIPHGHLQQLADLISAVHRVPELVRTALVVGDPPSQPSQWRCYECRICHMEVYACREGLPSASTPSGMPPEASADGCSIVAQGILLNLELVDAPLAELVGYSHAFQVVLPAQAELRNPTITKLLGAAGEEGLKLFERLTHEVDNWFCQHLRDLAVEGSSLGKEQEVEIREQALRDRDAIFARICQENGVGSDLVSLARAAESLASAIDTDSLPVDADIDDDHDFDEKCKDLTDFKERHGHCRVPRGWKENVELSNWVRNLRRKKIRGTLALDKIVRLEDLGFVWRKERKDSWEEHFAQLIEFKDRFGHCRVSRNWRENVKLGQWVQSLRRLKLSRRLGDDKIARLESIGFEWRLRQKEDDRDGEEREHAAPSHDEDDGDDDVDEDDSIYEDSAEEDEKEKEEKEKEEKGENGDDDHPRRDNAPSYTLDARWQKAMEEVKEQPKRIFAYYDGLRMEEMIAPRGSRTRSNGGGKTKKAKKAKPTAFKSWLPRPPTFNLNDIDEDEAGGDDDDDDEFDAGFEDEAEEEDDDDWGDAGSHRSSAGRAKRKLTSEKGLKGRPRSRSSEQRPASPLTTKSGVRACLECGVTKTPHWRRGPTNDQGEPAFLCNACGLRYYKTLQKSPVKRKRSKKQRTHERAEGSQDEEEEVAASHLEKRNRTPVKKRKKKEQSSKKRIKVPEVVTDSDSDRKEGDRVPGLAASAEETPTGGEERTKRRKRLSHDADQGTDGEGHERVFDGENAQHMPWLLAFKQKRRTLMAEAAAAMGTHHERPTGGENAATEEDEETFDFVE